MIPHDVWRAIANYATVDQQTGCWQWSQKARSGDNVYVYECGSLRQRHCRACRAVRRRAKVREVAK